MLGVGGVNIEKSVLRITVRNAEVYTPNETPVQRLLDSLSHYASQLIAEFQQYLGEQWKKTI